VFNEKCEFEEKYVYNVVKRTIDFTSVKKGEMFRVEKALKHLAHQVHHLLREHEGEADVGSILDSLAKLELHAQHATLPATLGREFAREIFEALVGHGGDAVLEPNIDYVNHREKPGKPAPVNLWTTSPDGSDADAHNAQVSPISDDESGEDIFDSDPDDMSAAARGSASLLPPVVLVLEYARSPKEFLNALMLAPELAECRDALSREDYSWKLKSGANIFVQPEHYKSVVAALKGRQLKPRHVIIAKEFEHSLNEALRDIGKGVRAKSVGTLPPAFTVIKRTFLHVPVPSSLRSEPNSDPVTVSTTDANPRTPTHPRRA